MWYTVQYPCEHRGGKKRSFFPLIINTHRECSFLMRAPMKSGTQGQESVRGLVTVIKYNGCLLEPCQAEARRKTMVSLWTERQSGSADWTELLSPSAALIQALFNTGLHPNSDQHQPSHKPAHCALHKHNKHKLWKKWLTLACRGSFCISQYVNGENVCLLRFSVWKVFQRLQNHHWN